MEEEASLLLNYAKKQLANTLKKKIKEDGTQEFLAKILGISQPKISRALYCKLSMSLSTAIHMMEVLGVYTVIDTRETEMAKRFKIFDKLEPKHCTYSMSHYIISNYISKNIF